MLSPTDLHGYQRRAAEFILATPACNVWLGLGLGKTISTLTALAELIDGCEVSRVLIVAPLRVARTVWAEEAANWTHTRHLRFRKALGSEQQRRTALTAQADAYIINRENVPWLVKHYGKAWPFDCIVIDESSSFKSSSSQRFKALRRVRRYADRVIALTATPASNGLIDLWAPTYLLDQGERLGRTKTAFLQRWFDADYFGRSFTPVAGADAEIHAKLSDITLSMQTEDYLEMPERVDLVIGVDLPQPALKHYETLKRTLLLELENDTIEATTAAVLAGKLLQACNGCVYSQDGEAHMHDAKLDALAELREQNPDDNMLVAYNYKTDLQRLRERFPDAVSITEPDAIERWNAGEIPILLAHPASAGHGLNLQHGGSLIVWFGLNWSLELYEQFNGRLHRQGQTKPVRVVHFVANDCIDERVLDTLKKKTDVQRNLLSALKDLLIDGGKE